MVSLWVVNASPIIMLAKIGRIDLLQRLGSPVVIADVVALEIQQRGPTDPAAHALSQSQWLTTIPTGPTEIAVAAYKIGPGESAVLSLALAHPGSGAILDDRAARNCAAALGIPHLGTLGLVLHAKATGIVPAARPLVDRLRQEGLYLSERIANQALAQVGE